MPTQSLTDQLRLLEEEITKHDQAATKGPWDNEGHTWIYAKVPNGRPNGEGIATFHGESHHGMTRAQDTSNAAFTAFARTALLDVLAVAKGLEGRLNEVTSASTQQHLAAADRTSSELAALRAENERLRAWLKKAGEDLTKESEAQAAEDLERYQKDPDYH